MTTDILIRKHDSTATAIDAMVRRIVAQFDPEQIVLFGSHARGTAGPDSDVDLLVIMPFFGSKRAKQLELRMAVYDVAVPKDIILVSPDEIAERRNVPGTVIQPAMQEGQVIYARGG